MDDPMRGVDYRHQARGLRPDPRARRRRGRTFLWYTTETEELDNCDRVYVFRNGRIVAKLERDEMTEEKVIQSSFHEEPWLSVSLATQIASPADSRRGAGAAPSAARAAAGAFAGAGPDRHRLAQPARHQLFRLQPDAEPGDPDRAGDDRADVRHHRQRPRPVDRHLRRLRRLRHRDLAARGAAVRRR